MDASARDWSQQYESLKKRIQYQRIKGIAFTNEDIGGIEKQINLLDSQLKTMANNAIRYELSSSEIARRELLIENMKKTISSFNGNNKNNSSSSTQYNSVSSNSIANPLRVPSNDRNVIQEKMKNQDEMVLEIGLGVDRLRNKALVIGEGW